LRLLGEAWLAARAEGLDVWQFAVEIDQLRALGLSHTDLRRLLHWGYLEHGRENARAANRQRFFQRLGTLVLPERTCFVLAAKGGEMVSEIGSEKGVREDVVAKELTALTCSLSAAPRWDSGGRQLWWKDVLVKEFHCPAPNQELVMAALEEEGWPTRIDDPLPPTPEIDPKVRLHDTIKSLNRHHLQRVLRFCGDGSGRGIRWLPVRSG
jgi:hypothetical protein